MVGVVVVGHNHFAEGLLSACDMIIGHHNHCKCVCLTEGVEAFSNELYGTLDEMSGAYDGVIVLADAKGGTPFNQSLRYKLEKAKDNMYIISGANLPLLMELVLRLEGGEDVGTLAAEVAAAGRESVLLEKVETEEDDEPDDVI